MVYTKACPSLELQTQPRFRPVSLSLSMAYLNEHLLIRKCGFIFLVEEGPGWFPAEELRQFYELPAQYEVSKAEKVLLGFNEVN